MSFWQSQTFQTPKPARKGVVFFLCAYGTKISLYRFPISQLLKRGYDVVGYQFDPKVISASDPSLLGRLISSIRKDIEQTIAVDYADPNLEVGLLGSSIGSFISYNILDIPQVKWVILNTGGNLAKGFWKIRATRKAFQKNGVTLEALEKAWHPLQNPSWNNPLNKRVLILASTGDRLATAAEALAAHKYLLSLGVSSKFIRIKNLNHFATIVHNLSRIGWLLNNIPKTR